MRACHARDGAALSEFFAWLEEELIEKGAKIDEVQAADKLEQIRSCVSLLSLLNNTQLTMYRKNHNFVGLSFDTISSTGPNAAVIHYKPQPNHCSVIDPNAIYLCKYFSDYSLLFQNPTSTTRDIQNRHNRLPTLSTHKSSFTHSPPTTKTHTNQPPRRLRRPIPRRHNRHNPHPAPHLPHAPRTQSLHPSPQRPHRPLHRHLPQRHHRLRTRHSRASIPLVARSRLPPRHRPRRRLLSQRA